jgi:hypothetical protein
MNYFSEEEIKELETIFGLKRKIVDERLPVRDGYVTKNLMVWWRNIDGPQLVLAGSHWGNIESFPVIVYEG